ncbi:MAG TPA: uracil-DNA glycosylase, partial [Stellaceae bacterium]|nr:uracil-DNA glycosylase [Stellaceae bacterium]
PPPLPSASPPPRAAPPPAKTAVSAASLSELEAEVRAFSGCGLKATATQTVFADGVAGAPLMVIGEAPGAEEDRQGRPFVGRSGQLLDRMLAAIGRNRRQNAYITNVIFWRPPGNRKPTGEEVASCLPFVHRHIQLLAPKAILLCGNVAIGALTSRKEGVIRLRGNWFDLEIIGHPHKVPALATYHPSFLLRTPSRKGEAWRDLLDLERRLQE